MGTKVVGGHPKSGPVRVPKGTGSPKNLWKQRTLSGARKALPLAFSSTPALREAYIAFRCGKVIYDNKDTIGAGITCVRSGECDDWNSRAKADIKAKAEDMTEEAVLDKILEMHGVPPDTASSVFQSLGSAARTRPSTKKTLKLQSQRALSSSVSRPTESRVYNEKWRGEPRRRKERRRNEGRRKELRWI